MEILETSRLQLRPLTPEIYQHAFESLAEEALMEFFGCRNQEELEEERKKYREGLSMYRKSFLAFQLILKESGEMIGWCGFHTWYVRHNRAEIGYQLNEDRFKQKGYMSEALPVVIRYGFGKMNLHRIEAMVGKDNVPSLRLLQSMGFQQEGMLKEHYLVDGVYEDSLVFGLVRKL